VKAEDAALDECDCVVSCLPHGESARWMERVRAAGVRAIDLSADLRVPGVDTPEWAREAVYGLPELHRERIAGAQLVANPGCYPTAAILALAPLLRRGLAAGPVIVNAASGVTGAGRSPKRELLFAEVADDYRAYGVGNTHRHLHEMRATLRTLGADADLVFTPHLLPVARGILSTITVPLTESLAEPLEPFRAAYANEPFIELTDEQPTLREVAHRNVVRISATMLAGTRQPTLLVTSAIDNLLKGAAGQAVQNANLMCGIDECAGLPA
jgi:N-acetyl-gamma-glutamyl-phosphate reductase